MREKRMVQAITNLMPAKVIGGRSARPSLINNQVEPQIPQRINRLSRAFIVSFQLPIADHHLATGNWQSAMKLPVWLRFDNCERSTLGIEQDSKTAAAGSGYRRLHELCPKFGSLLDGGVSVRKPAED